MMRSAKKITQAIQEDFRAWKELRAKTQYQNVNYAIWRLGAELSIARDDLEQLSHYEGLLLSVLRRRLDRKITRLEKLHRYHQATYEQMLEMHSYANR